MQRPHSARSDGSDADGDGSAEQEAELLRLQKEIRILENDKHAYSTESQNNIKMKKIQIGRLEKENDELTKTLKLIESRSNQKENDRQSENLEELGKQKKDVEKQIEDEKEKQKVLDAQIREAEKKLQKEREKESEKKSKQRSAGGGDGGEKGGMKKNSEDKRKIRKLEDQLQLANNKFGKALEANKELRKEIDNLRVERQRFDNIYKKLDKERQQLQQETNDIMDHSTQAYDQRVEAQEKMVMLREKAEKDIQQHNAEMKELIRIIDHDYKLRQFMNTKGKERDEDKQLATWRERKEAMMTEKKKANQTDSVESYDAAFARIKDITQEEDISLIVNRFIEVEDQNFALFNFVNDQNNQIEVLQDQIEQVRNDIRRFQSQGVELESKRQMILKQLEERQTLASKQADEADARYKELGKIIDQLKSGISSVFTNTGCDRAAIDDMLGSNEGIADNNMLQYLGLIEERTNELLLAQAYILKQSDYEQYARHQPVLLGEGPHPQHSQALVHPPAVGDEFDDDISASEDENRPLTKEELMEKAMKSVRKREHTTKKQGIQYDLSDSHDKSKKKDKHTKTGKEIMRA